MDMLCVYSMDVCVQITLFMNAFYWLAGYAVGASEFFFMWLFFQASKQTPWGEMDGCPWGNAPTTLHPHGLPSISSYEVFSRTYYCSYWH